VHGIKELEKNRNKVMLYNYILTEGKSDYTNIVIILCNGGYQSSTISVNAVKNKEGNEKATKGRAVRFAFEKLYIWRRTG